MTFSFSEVAANNTFRDGYLPPEPVTTFFDGLGVTPVELAKGAQHIFSHRSLVPFRFDEASFQCPVPVEDSTYGYLVLSRFDAVANQAVVDFVDLSSRETLHTWRGIAEDRLSTLNEYPHQASLQRDKNRLGMRMMHHLALEDGSLICQNHSFLVKIDHCSALEWVNADSEFHHCLEMDHGGNYWVPSRIFDSEMRLVSFQGNRDYFRDEDIAVASSEGEVLMDTNLIKIFEETDLGVYLFGMDYGHLGSRHHDSLHINDIEPIVEGREFWNRGDAFLSFSHRSMVILYRPKTNTVVCYKVGPWLHQHNVDIVGPSQIFVFNNNAIDPLESELATNDVVLFDFASDTIARPFRAPFEQQEARTFYEGRSPLMDNGQFSVEKTNHGRAMVLDSPGAVAWSYLNKASSDNERVGALGWSRLIFHYLGDAIWDSSLLFTRSKELA